MRNAQPYWLTLEREAWAQEVALAQQMQQVSLHLIGAEPLGAAVVVPRQSGHGVDVGGLRSRCHAAHLQRVKHATAQWADPGLSLGGEGHDGSP